jgi:uncharacterized protein YycO
MHIRFKPRYIVIPIVCIIAAAILLVLTLRLRRTLLVNEYLDKIESVVQDGDIICRLGDRVWSLYFRRLSHEDKRFSHLGIVHIKNDNRITVINAEAAGGDDKNFVKEQPLEVFIQKARLIGVYRMDAIDGAKIAAEALTFLGRPFDWAFDKRTADKIYCTELLYWVLQSIGPEIQLKTVRKYGIDIVPLEAVSDSGYFRELLYIE